MRLAVSPAPLVSTAERQVSEIQLDLAVRVSTYTISGFTGIIKLFGSCLFHKDSSLFFILLQPPFRLFHTVLCFLSPWQATGALLVRLWPQLCHVLPATSAHRVVQLQSSAHQELIRTERNTQPALSVRQVGSLIYSLNTLRRNICFFSFFKHFYLAWCHFSFA